MKQIKVSDNTHRRLKEKKEGLGKGSIGDVIDTLLDLPLQKRMIKEAVSEAIVENR